MALLAEVQEVVRLRFCLPAEAAVQVAGVAVQILLAQAGQAVMLVIMVPAVAGAVLHYQGLPLVQVDLVAMDI